MRALFLFDQDSGGALADDLRGRVLDVLHRKGYDVDVFPLGAADVKPCTGCLRCHIDRLGACVEVDGLSSVNARIPETDVVCFVGPIHFGQMGSTIKGAMEKVQTNWLRTRHTVVIGYGDDVSDDEVATFLDIVNKHGGTANVVHPRFQARNEVYAARSVADDCSIGERLESTL